MRKTRKVYVNDEVMSTAGVPVADFDAEEAYYQADGDLSLVLRDSNGEGSVLQFWVYEPYMDEDMYLEGTESGSLMVAGLSPLDGESAETPYISWEEYVEQRGDGVMCVPRDVYSEAVYHIKELGIKNDIDRYRDAVGKLTHAAGGKFDTRLYGMCEILSESLQDRLTSLGVDIYSTPDKTVFADAYKSMVESGLYSNMMDVYSCYDMLKDVYGRRGAKLADVAEVSDIEGDRRVEDADAYKDAMNEYADAMDKYIETVGPENLSAPCTRDDVLYDAAYIIAGVKGYESRWGVDDRRLANEGTLREAAKDVRLWTRNYEKRMAERVVPTVSVVNDDYGDDVEKTPDYGLSL